MITIFGMWLLTNIYHLVLLIRIGWINIYYWYLLWTQFYKGIYSKFHSSSDQLSRNAGIPVHEASFLAVAFVLRSRSLPPSWKIAAPSSSELESGLFPGMPGSLESGEMKAAKPEFVKVSVCLQNLHSRQLYLFIHSFNQNSLPI